MQARLAKDGLTSPYLGVSGLGFCRCTTPGIHDVWSTLGWTPPSNANHPEDFWISCNLHLKLNPLHWLDVNPCYTTLSVDKPPGKMRKFYFFLRKCSNNVQQNLQQKYVLNEETHQKTGQPRTLKATSPVWGSQVGYVCQYSPYFTAAPFFGVGHLKFPHFFINWHLSILENPTGAEWCRWCRCRNWWRTTFRSSHVSLFWAPNVPACRRSQVNLQNVSGDGKVFHVYDLCFASCGLA